MFEKATVSYVTLYQKSGHSNQLNNLGDCSHDTQQKHRLFPAEQTAEAIRIVEQADKLINPIVKELGIDVSTVQNKQS